MSGPQIVLHSSWGDMRFSADGVLLDQTVRTSDDQQAANTVYDEEGWPRQLNIAEWKRYYPGEDPCGSEWGILDWGYWTADGSYEPPAVTCRLKIVQRLKEALLPGSSDGSTALALNNDERLLLLQLLEDV